MTTKEWLESPPTKVSSIINGQGEEVYYIPIEDVITDLNTLTSSIWNTNNFIHSITPFSKTIIVSGSIELTIKYAPLSEIGKVFGYNGPFIERKLVGAATLDIRQYKDNPHWAATLKSLCITNAVIPLGKRFGMGLNPKQDIPKDISSEDGYDDIETQIKKQLSNAPKK